MRLISAIMNFYWSHAISQLMFQILLIGFLQSRLSAHALNFRHYEFLLVPCYQSVNVPNPAHRFFAIKTILRMRLISAIMNFYWSHAISQLMFQILLIGFCNQDYLAHALNFRHYEFLLVPCYQSVNVPNPGSSFFCKSN